MSWLPPSKVVVLEAINERAHRELAERYAEELQSLEAVGLGRSGAAQGALLRERDAALLKSLLEQTRVIVDAALARWRLVTMIFAMLVTVLLLISGSVVYVRATTPAELELARALAYAVGAALVALLGLGRLGDLVKIGGRDITSG